MTQKLCKTEQTTEDTVPANDRAGKNNGNESTMFSKTKQEKKMHDKLSFGVPNKSLPNRTGDPHDSTKRMPSHTLQLLFVTVYSLSGTVVMMPDRTPDSSTSPRSATCAHVPKTVRVNSSMSEQSSDIVSRVLEALFSTMNALLLPATTFPFRRQHSLNSNSQFCIANRGICFQLGDSILQGVMFDCLLSTSTVNYICLADNSSTCNMPPEAPLICTRRPHTLPQLAYSSILDSSSICSLEITWGNRVSAIHAGRTLQCG